MNEQRWKVTLERTVCLSTEVYVYASNASGAKNAALAEARSMNDEDWDVGGSEVGIVCWQAVPEGTTAG